MSVHKRETATKGTVYVVRWRDPRPRERTFARQIAAERFERKVRHEVDVGTYSDPRLAKITLSRWYERWWQTIEGSDRSPNTIAQYENIAKNHIEPHLGSSRIASLKQIDFEEWLAELRNKDLGVSAMRTARTIVFMVMESAMDAGIVSTNHATRLKVALAPLERSKHSRPSRSKPW